MSDINNKDKEQLVGGLKTKNQLKKIDTSKPLISIVTVVYNGEKFIEEAILSVINQDYNNFEYIILDGASKDNTINIIKKYEDKIDYWKSESDEGQSDAFNKAFELCSGDLVSWVNADDILLPGTLSNVAEIYINNPGIKWITGNIIWMDEQKNILLTRKGEKWSNSLTNCGILNVYGPSTFFSLDIFNKVGKLQNWMHYRMDTDLWWRFVKLGLKYKRSEKYYWALRVHADAKTTAKYIKGTEENNPNHPSNIAMKKEDEYITNKYKKRCKFSTLILILHRLFSKNYIIGIIDSFKYRKKSLDTII